MYVCMYVFKIERNAFLPHRRCNPMLCWKILYTRIKKHFHNNKNEIQVDNSTYFQLARTHSTQLEES